MCLELPTIWRRVELFDMLQNHTGCWVEEKLKEGKGREEKKTTVITGVRTQRDTWLKPG